MNQRRHVPAARRGRRFSGCPILRPSRRAKGGNSAQTKSPPDNILLAAPLPWASDKDAHPEAGDLALPKAPFSRRGTARCACCRITARQRATLLPPLRALWVAPCPP